MAQARKWVLAVAVIGAAAGCGVSSGAGTDSTPRSAGTASTAGAAVAMTTATTAAAAPPAPAPAVAGACHARGSGEMVLPDPACTPGATNPAVTQADIASTICTDGWTATVRPPESYTEPLKIRQMAAYGDSGPTGSYEEDHLISLELGGSPTDPRNLWPEPGASPNPKDSVEDAAHTAVCDSRMTLAAAQQAIATDWIALGQQLGVTTAGASGGATADTTGTAGTTAASAGCQPKTAAGNCYKQGEYCPSADHGLSGTDASGATITCRDDGGWRWE